MSDDLKELYNTFSRVRDFGVTNQADFAAGSKGDENFKLFVTKLPLIEASGAIQASNEGKTATGIKESAAVLLREYLRKINHTARSAGVDHPEIAELFRMPHGNSYPKLLVSANAFLASATAHKTVLVDYEMPADFLTVLQARISSLQDAMSDHNEIKDAKVGATANIEAVTKELSDALRRLRGIVRNIYENNPAKLAEWTSASHIVQSAPKAKIKPDANK